MYGIDNGEHRDLTGNPTATNNFDIGKLDMAAGCRITKTWGLEIGCTPAIYGRTTSKGTTYTAAVFLRMP